MKRITYQGLTAEQWEQEASHRWLSANAAELCEQYRWLVPQEARQARRAERIANILSERES